MDINPYLLPYEIIAGLTGQPLFVTQSVRFGPGHLNYNRYFINLDETARPLVKSSLAGLASSLQMPASAADLLLERASKTDIAFIGVSEEAGKWLYKIYLGFIGLHDIQADGKAYSIEWIPGNDKSAVKEYFMQPEVTEEEAAEKARACLAGVMPGLSAMADDLYELCLEIASLTDYTTHFLSATQQEAPKSSVYYNLTGGAPVLFKDIQDKLLRASGLLGILQPDLSEWLGTLKPDDILEHLAIGASNDHHPFITFYKNGEQAAPYVRPSACSENTASEALQENHTNIKHSTYMEQNDKHFHRTTKEAGYATVLPQRQYPTETLPQPSELADYPVKQEITPSCGCEAGGGQLVFALGDINYDFPSSEVRDSLEAEIGSLDPEHFLKVLGGRFSDNLQGDAGSAIPDPNRHENKLFYAQSVIWTFNLDNTPIYAIRPEGPFAQDAYATLRNFMVYQIEVEKKYRKSGFKHLVRSTLAGKTQGTIRLSSGFEVPVVIPELRGMYAWTVGQLLDALLGPAPAQGSSSDVVAKYEDSKSDIIDFLERVYFALRNVGVTSKDRAINFSATNAFQIAVIFEKAYKEHLSLLSIDAVKSPFCRPGADCWDVVLVFFNPMKQLEEAKTVFRFTVDVSSVVPTLTGPMRSWKE